MNDSRFALVEFQGDTLLTIFDGQTVRVAMKPLVESLGIDWRSQRQKILADPVISKGVALSTTPSEGGPQQSMTLPIDLMHGWLFKLNPERVAPGARERVIAYQAECYQVLHAYWVKGGAINPRHAATAPASIAEIIKLGDQVKAETNPGLRAAYYEMLQQGLTSRGVVTPTLEELSIYHGDDIEAGRMLERIDALVREQPRLDYHRTDALMAVRMLDLARAGLSLSKPVKAALRRHPRFVKEVAVNAPEQRSVWCWVFRAA